MRAMLDYDLVGFQTERDRTSAASCRTRCRRRWSGRVLTACGGTHRVDSAFPIGIESTLRSTGREPQRRRAIQRMVERPGRARADHRRRSARLQQGPCRSLRRLRALPGRIPGDRRGGDLLQIAPLSAATCADMPRSASELEQASGRDQRPFARLRLDADPLREPQLSRTTCSRASIAPRAGRPRDAAARRHEPRRQGISSPRRTRKTPAC